MTKDEIISWCTAACAAQMHGRSPGNYQELYSFAQTSRIALCRLAFLHLFKLSCGVPVLGKV
ncbi:hypothetical protein E2C01_091970 [Portunus trituberculatus]|uniref:Uncharacterized protein n=1 Tax=Portunus trituberculatus TaxID=210409 RepID=A0A5B7JQ46_PORTR|nr:hypothetical protein [Portunus trituberculatus]